MLKRLFQHVPSARMLLVISVSLGLAGGVLIILQAVYLARITDQAFLGGKGWTSLLPAMFVLLGWIGLRAVVHTIGEITATQMAAQIKNDLRKRLVRHLTVLGPQYAKGERSGELIGTVYEGVENLETYLARYLPQIALSALIPIAILGIVGSLDWITTAILAGTAPLIVFFMILIGKSAKTKAERQWGMLGLLSAHFLDVLRGLTTLKIFNRSKTQLDVIGRISDEYRKTTMGTLRIAFLSALVMELLTSLSTAVVAVFLGLRLLSGQLDFHRAFLVLLLAPEFYLPIRLLGTQFHAGMNGVSAANRIFDILSTEPLGWVEREGTVCLPTKAIGYRIEFERVGYTYAGSKTPALSDVSFTIEPGERVAVVGPTGAGKSTLLDLLLGFIRPTEGRILIDGVDISELSPVWWRTQIASIAQRAHLFHGTIAENIRMANPGASMEEVVHAAEQALADAFIRVLPDGYDTRISEAIRLSGGQIQRLAIARAFLKNTPLLLMDEPTAQLDVESEKDVQQGLDGLLKNKTAIMIAHRLGMIHRTDKIIVLHQGRMVEQGKHEDLLDSGGLYYQLVQAYKQAGIRLSHSSA